MSKLPLSTRASTRSGSALLLTLIMTGLALLMLAGVMTWSSGSTRMTFRANQYQRAVAAAEASTEKALTRVSADYLHGGEALVVANLSTYRAAVPAPSDSSYWTNWEFNDAAGGVGKVNVQSTGTSNYVVLNSTFAGLQGYATPYNIIANARQTGIPEVVYGGVAQQLLLARIPIFQFAMYTTGDMEVSCGQPFVVTGRVHSNANLYVEPDDVLTFQSSVTAVGDIIFGRSPDDSRGTPSGSVVYQGSVDSHVTALTLPIGITNSPTAVREIIQPAPLLEDPSSPLGRLRYYNLTDLMIIVTNSTGTNYGVRATSGGFNSFATIIPTNQVRLFVWTNSFWDEREGKTICSIDLDVGKLRSWSATNDTLKNALGNKDLCSVYVYDRRILPGTMLAAVRVVNGVQLPPRGLTVATSRPLYVKGHFNQPSILLQGTAVTTNTYPASLVGDAITVLSGSWSDANGAQGIGSRKGADTTVNAAFLAGAVETVDGYYGGGMENFPRFLEDWGKDNVFTYNGSMIKMFPSQFATNRWNRDDQIYKPPARNWAFDANFNTPTMLPPLTPSLLRVVRGQWFTMAPNKTTLPTP